MTDDVLMHTYFPTDVTFVRGSGTELWDNNGKRYLDFLSGLAVTSLGHSHPEVAQAVAEQANCLVHVSNLYGNELAPKVAAQLNGLLGGNGRVFFANSGAEANECALKLARKWAGDGRYVVVSALNSFHGRTLATLHATGQVAKHKAFQPLPEGFVHVPYQDIVALEQALQASDVAAVLLECVQGEGGVYPASPEYLQAVERLCREKNVLLMIDEIQTGLGRTGRWFSFEHAGISPDVVTMAKALGNGMPVGACWARAEVADAFVPGDHGTTYGGQPLAMAAVLATLTVMQKNDVPTRASKAGQRLRDGLETVPGIAGVRGLGLLLAVELQEANAKEVANKLLENGLVVNGVTDTALRLAPSLLVSDSEIDEAVETIRATLA